MTNSALHILLLVVQTIFATIISQIINVILGYYLYGSRVFKHKKYNNKTFKKYLFLAFVLLWLNTPIFSPFGENRIIMPSRIPPLILPSLSTSTS